MGGLRDKRLWADLFSYRDRYLYLKLTFFINDNRLESHREKLLKSSSLCFSQSLEGLFCYSFQGLVLTLLFSL